MSTNFSFCVKSRNLYVFDARAKFFAASAACMRLCYDRNREIRFKERAFANPRRSAGGRPRRAAAPFVIEQRLLICIPLNGAYLKSAFERKRRSWRNDRVLRRGFAAHSDFHSSLFPKEPRPPSEIRFAAHRMRLPYAPVIRIASIGTAKIAESATRLSTVGNDSPCCHL